MVKLLVLLAIVFFAASASADTRVVDEGTINKWNYRTVSTNNMQFIKRIRRVPGDGPAYYPRFYLWRECFDTPDKALSRKQEIETLKLTSIEHRDYDYRHVVFKVQCAFFVNTDSNYFRLEFLPDVLGLYEEYLESELDS